MAVQGAPAPIRRAGVVGAGTMGAGIAQTLAQAGIAVRLVDVDPAAVATAVAQIEGDLLKGRSRGRWSEGEASAARGRLATSCDMADLHEAELVIEAVPERLDLKLDVLGRLAKVCGPDAVLATNTSSLLVSELAAGTPGPERVLGLHFFNPAPRMRLVEVVAGPRTNARTLAVGVATVEALGKHPVRARDGIGFLVNRVARPFYGEALKLVQEGIATVAQADRICRLAGGFRLGPMELIDLIGVDVNLAIAKSFYEQSFGEPRWRPSALQARMVAAGDLGRKAGRGFYDYAALNHRPADPQVAEPQGGAGRRLDIIGGGPVAAMLAERADRGGFAVAREQRPDAVEPWLSVDVRAQGPAIVESGPLLVSCAASSLARRGPAGAAGFHLLPLPICRLAELTASAGTEPSALERSAELFGALGLEVEQVGDAPGLVMGRIAAQLVNEARFAIGEGVGTAEDIDAGTTLGLNYPYGIATLDAMLGDDYVRSVIGGLWTERQEERYRLAPPLRGA